MAFSSEYQVVYDALVTAGDTPSAPIANIQDQLVRYLIYRGYWTRFDLLHILAQEFNSGGGALINWPNPGTFDATEVNAPTFTSQEGFTGDGSTSYLNTNYKPRTDAINITTISSARGHYLRSDIQELAGDYEATPGGVWASQTKYPTNTAYVYDSTGFLTTTVTDSRGLFIFTRTGASAIEFYRNGGSIGTDTDAAGTLPTGDLWLLRGLGQFATRPMSIFFVMNGITDTEALELFVIFETYMQNIGSGVAPELFASCDESASITEAQTADTGEETGTVAESASITEAQTAQAELNGADAESASINDTPTAQAVFNSSVSESATISESQATEAENAATVSESASIDDTPVAQAELNADVSESASITEAQSGTVESEAAVAESASITEAQTGEVVSGAESASTAESASINDLQTVQAELSDLVSESATISDSCSAQLISYVDVTESAAIAAVQSVTGDELFNERFITGVVQESVNITGVVQESVSVTGVL